MEKLCVFADDFDRQLPGASASGAFLSGHIFSETGAKEIASAGDFCYDKQNGGIML